MATISVVLNKTPGQFDVVEGITRFLSQLSQEKFYGVIEIQYVDGKIVVVRKEETINPSAFLL